MIKIYEIELKNLQQVKNVLEEPDVAGEELNVELEKDAGKKGGVIERARKWKINEWKKVGYLLREARALNIEKNVFYLYVNAEDNFFRRNEKEIVTAGAKELRGAEFEKVKNKIESLEQTAAEGLGFIFG